MPLTAADYMEHLPDRVVRGMKIRLSTSETERGRDPSLAWALGVPPKPGRDLWEPGE